MTYQVGWLDHASENDAHFDSESAAVLYAIQQSEAADDVLYVATDPAGILYLVYLGRVYQPMIPAAPGFGARDMSLLQANALCNARAPNELWVRAECKPI